jgi:GTP-sensing pleiotropic transcriptional regulator CodY
MVEIDVIKKLKKSGDILVWLRYADDICCFMKNRSFNKIFQKINSWDKDLFFPSTNMNENSLKFLDCELFIINEKIEFNNYRKFGLNTILQNYKKSVMAKRYLISNIWTQIHNVANSSSNEIYLSEGLKNLETIFIGMNTPDTLLRQN